LYEVQDLPLVVHVYSASVQQMGLPSIEQLALMLSCAVENWFGSRKQPVIEFECTLLMI